MSALARAHGTSDDWVERVRAASDIVEVITPLVPLRRAGRNFVGRCPFHTEKTPSFSVNAERQFYHCFGCKAGGDVFKFVQETERVGFLEAVELLSRRAGIPVPERRAGERNAKTPLLEALSEAATAYAQWLGDPRTGAPTRAYLEERGLLPDTIRAFGLGLAPEGWTNLVDRLRGRVAEEALIEAGLAARRDGGRVGLYDRFRNRLMIPLVESGGAVVGFAARAQGDDQPKYLNSPETRVYHKGAFLFALEQARRATRPDGELVVVEGQFDAIALHQAGIVNTVATSGTALTAEQAKRIQRLVGRVALTYDGDAAGQEAMMRSLGVLLAQGLEVAVVDLPAGLDPDTLLRDHGLEGWNERRATAYDPVGFVQRHVLRAAAGGDPRERALQAVVALAAGMPDPIRIRLLLERAAEVFGLGEAVLARATALKRKGQGVEQPIRAAVRERRRLEDSAERSVLAGLLHSPAALIELKQLVSVEDFQDPVHRALAEFLWGASEGLPEDPEVAALARELSSVPQGRFEKDEEETYDWHREATGAARSLVRRRLARRMKEIERLTSETSDAEEQNDLMKLYQETAESLSRLEAEKLST